jgi:adenosine deaminase
MCAGGNDSTRLSMRDISLFIANLPKAELHMHLEGSLGSEMILAMAQRDGIRPPYADAAALRRARRRRSGLCLRGAG